MIKSGSKKKFSKDSNKVKNYDILFSEKNSKFNKETNSKDIIEQEIRLYGGEVKGIYIKFYSRKGNSIIKMSLGTDKTDPKMFKFIKSIDKGEAKVEVVDYNEAVKIVNKEPQLKFAKDYIKKEIK